MATTSAILMTADELAQLPCGGYSHELVYGEIRTMSPSGNLSSVVALNIGFVLKAFLKTRPGFGVACGAEGGFRLTLGPDTVRSPDVAFVRADRLPSGGPPEGFFPGAPDLAVEVLSPTDSLAATLEKADFWIFHGTREVWVVDPAKRSVRVRRPGHEERILEGEAALDGGDVLPGFLVPVSEFFRL